MTIQACRPIARPALWALLIAATAFGVSTSAQTRRSAPAGVTVYDNPNFGGQSASFRTDTPTMVPSGMNDKISSIQIPDGETWEVCQDIDYGSQCQTLSSSVSDLRSMGWNDRISSLRRTDNGGFRDGGFGGRRSNGVGTTGNSGVGVTVYVNPNFGGQSASFHSDTPNLLSSGLNDQISSIRIPDGETWEMCQDIDYGNQCQSLSSSVSDLRSMGWDNRISSLRRTDNSGGFGDGRYRGRRSDGASAPSVQQRLVFYDRPDYQGASTFVTSGAPRTAFSAKQGSVQLRGGGTWELCNQAGRCATVDQDVSKIGQLGLKGRITFARLVNDSDNRRNRGGERIR